MFEEDVTAVRGGDAAASHVSVSVCVHLFVTEQASEGF